VPPWLRLQHCPRLFCRRMKSGCPPPTLEMATVSCGVILREVEIGVWGCEGKHTKSQQQKVFDGKRLLGLKITIGQHTDKNRHWQTKIELDAGLTHTTTYTSSCGSFSFMRWILLIIRMSLFLSVWSLRRKCPTLVPSIFITSDRSIISGPPTDDPKKRSFHMSHFIKCGCETLFKAKRCGHFSDIFTVVGGGSRQRGEKPTVFII